MTTATKWCRELIQWAESMAEEAQERRIRCATEGHSPFRSASCPTCHLLTLRSPEPWHRHMGGELCTDPACLL